MLARKCTHAPIRPVRRTLAPAAARVSAPAQPQGPTADEAGLRAPGLLLGFPVTPSGGLASRTNPETTDDDATPLELDEVNDHFKRTTSLEGAGRCDCVAAARS
jgi:hypothetical protein